MGSISNCSEKFVIEVPSSFIVDSQLSFDSIKSLLELHSAYLDDKTILTYYDHNIKAFRKLGKTQLFDYNESEEIEILIKNSFISEYPYILQKIDDLNERISELARQVGEQEEEDQKIVTVKENIDIAVLYAAPLVKEDKGKLRSCDAYNVNISKERENMLSEFRKNEINKEIRFEVATLKNLKMVMEWNPKIVHISCHGYYLSYVSDFVLAFESSDCIGLTEEVNKTSLQRIFQAYPNFSGIFVISSCYSQAIQDVLKEAGIKYFVVVHKDCKIHDNAAIIFAAKFYKNLFLGNEISKSFESAWKHLKTFGCGAIEVCCCVHKHSKNCPFKDSLTKHMDHTPTEDLCKCNRQEMLNKHKLDCQWAKKFLYDHKLVRSPTREEIKEGYWIICCCPDYMVPHHDYEKFILVKNTPENSFTLYTEYDNGDSNSSNPFENLLKPDQVAGELVGRGNELYVILRKLQGKYRILMLYGLRDVGKTSVIKYAAQYGYDRKMFKNGVIYIDMKKKRYAKDVFITIGEKLSLFNLHMESLAKNLESLQILIIIDNADLMNEQEINDLCNKITYLHDYTKYPKFCIVRRNPIERELFQKFKLDKLEPKVCGLLIKNYLGEALYRKVRDELKVILKGIDSVPSNVLNYMNLLKTKSISEVLHLVEAEKKNLTLTENDALQNFITNLHARSPETLNFLKILSKFPAGIYKSELPGICATLNFNLENILGVLKSKQSSIIDLDSAIFCVPEKLAGLLNRIEAPEFNYGQYLKNLAESIYKNCFNQSYRLDILKSTTGLFYNCNENFTEPGKYFPKTVDDPFLVFEEMIPNFAEFIQFKRDAKISLDLDHNIYDICIYCSKVFVLKKNRKEVDKLIKEAISHLKHLKTHESILIKKLKLFEYSVSYELCDSNLDKVRDLEALVEKIKLYFDLPPNSDERLQGETYLLKALILIKKNNLENVKLFFEKSEKRFFSQKFQIERARVLLAKSTWLLDQDPEHGKILRNLNYAKSVFSEIKAVRLEEESIFCIGRHYFQKEQWLECENYWNQGLKIASQLGDRNLEIKYKEKLTQTYAQIRKASKNVISILRAYPIVCTEKYKDINETVFCTHFLNFKDELVDTLINDNKIICLKFEIGTRMNLIQQIEQGCRVLHISTVIPHSDKLVLENEDFTADVLTMDLLEKLLEDKLVVHGVELVVLAIPFSHNLAEFFYNRLKVPNVICFDFEQVAQIKYLTQLQKMFETAVDKFCISFYHNIIEGKSIKTAWKISKKLTDSFIKSNSGLFEHLENFDRSQQTTYKGKGPFLFGDGERALFTDSRQDILASENILHKGKLINMSSLKPPTNIPRKNNSFVGRHKTMHEVIKILKEDKIVHIYGDQGIGKTKLIQHIGVYLNGRGYYKHGTFYESLKGCNSLDKFKDLTRVNEGQEGVKKDMFLIIDDCEYLLRELTPSFISFLDKIQGELGIHVIISSLPIDFPYNCKKIELKPLEPLESAGLFMAVYQGNLKRKDIRPYNEAMDIARDLTQSNLIKDCMNNPSKILRLIDKLKESNFIDLEVQRASHNPLMKKHPSELELPNFQYSVSYVENEDSEEDKEGAKEEVKQNQLKTPKIQSKGQHHRRKNDPSNKKKNTLPK